MTPKEKIKIIVTTAAVLIGLIHLFFPAIKIDSITITLLIIAIVPWLEPLFKSVGLPGGFKFDFQELKKIEADAKNAGLITNPAASTKETMEITKPYDFLEIVQRNSELALLTLRIEIEKRLRDIAASYQVETSGYSAARLLSILRQKNILAEDEATVLNNMLSVLTQVTQQTTVDKQHADWVIENGPSIISNLEKKIKK